MTSFSLIHSILIKSFKNLAKFKNVGGFNLKFREVTKTRKISNIFTAFILMLTFHKMGNSLLKNQCLLLKINFSN